MGEVRVVPASEEDGPLRPRDEHHYVEVARSGWTVQHSLECFLAGRLLDCPWTTFMQDRGERLMRHPGLGTWRIESTRPGTKTAFTEMADTPRSQP